MVYIPRLVTRVCQGKNTTNALGLDYSIPSEWNQVTIDKSYDEINGIAQKAINVMRDTFWGPDPAKVDFGWGTGTTLSALAYKDMVASTKDNHDFVKAVMQAAKNHNENFDPYGYNDDAQWWGTTAFYAYRAYGDQEFLGWAIDVWNWVASSQITPDQAAAGKSPVRDQAIKSECNGKSNAGAMFWRSPSSERTDMGVNVITTGLFETLSAYLAEATGEQKYLDAAIQAYEFITRSMFREDPNIPLDGMSLTDCGANNWVFTYNTGKFIEGAVILSSLTKDDKYKNQALKTIVDAVKKVENWNDGHGFITEGQDGDPAKGNDGRQFKAIYVRALTEVARREWQNSDLRNLLYQYININYNAAITKDTDGNGNYGLTWKGPYAGPYESAQMNILDLLVAGVEFNWKR
ncbi:Six-hairpin glycosidase [Auricularia subglabra TFB-10046 SS5]|uniref:Six-hairpin glycosidase n=1 Tax=Auricularia subglabra (strain TFB-10046 / SS5) TaxID=717982 RepID=J0CXG2_AURST|nr:Six-hairpin glycosidase [Auricularia subglabra TFB-10046 SS5]